MKAECRTETKGAEIVLKDSGKPSRMRFHNPDLSPCVKVRVDGCEINDDTRRCDYLLLHCDKSKATVHEYFVELKGTKLKDALEQLDNSIRRLSAIRSRTAIVVSSRGAPQTDSSLMNLKARFQKNHNCTLKIFSNNHGEMTLK